MTNLSSFLKDTVSSRHKGQGGRRFAAVGGLLLLLTGCSSLPASGPTEAQFNRAQRDTRKNTVGYGIVQISPDLITLLESEGPPLLSSLEGDNPPVLHYNNDRVGPGDVLQISIYEVGSSLFSSTSSMSSSGSSSSGKGGSSGGSSGAASAAGGGGGIFPECRPRRPHLPLCRH